MITKIIITVPTNCENYKDVVEATKQKIVGYFGSKFAQREEIHPIVTIFNCPVTEEDLQILYDNLFKDVILLVIVSTESKQVKGDFIYLNPE